MDFKISKRYFYNALSVVARAISANSPLPALSGIKIEVLENEIVLTASDSFISIQKRLVKENEEFKLDIFETGSIVIEAKYILEIVRKIDSDEIHIELIDGSLTKISGYFAEFNINGTKAMDYPVIDFSKPDNKFNIDAGTLLKIINQTAFATSDKETRPVLTGVNFKKEGNVLECVATDSYRLAKKVVSLNNQGNFNITIPAKALNEIAKSIERESEIEVCVSDKKVQFWIDSIVVQSRLIDGIYPETNRLIPNEFSYELVVDARDILNAIDRASFIKSDGISIIKLSASENEIVISSKSQEVGSSKEKLTAISYKGQPLEISFSGRYVFDAIRALSGPIVKIEFGGDMKPFVLQSMDDDSILQLVLPVRTYS